MTIYTIEIYPNCPKKKRLHRHQSQQTQGASGTSLFCLPISPALDLVDVGLYGDMGQEQVRSAEDPVGEAKDIVSNVAVQFIGETAVEMSIEHGSYSSFWS